MPVSFVEVVVGAEETVGNGGGTEQPLEQRPLSMVADQLFLEMTNVAVDDDRRRVVADLPPSCDGRRFWKTHETLRKPCDQGGSTLGTYPRRVFLPVSLLRQVFLFHYLMAKKRC